MAPSGEEVLSRAPLVVFGWGNESRGDDGLGPLLLQQVEDLARACPALGLETVLDFQLQVEHVEDLADRRLALFLDASRSAEPPFEFTELREQRDSSFTSHALSPEALLHAHRKVLGTAPPPCFLLAVRGDGFELGDSLSRSASGNMAEAWTFLRSLLTCPTAEAWRPRLRPARPGP
ncbi:MAG: hydrogenase maturation protease [Acidobacteria bacterium]|nr:hydrogenase maturation protease [Acidobacteriota bacterium]